MNVLSPRSPVHPESAHGRLVVLLLTLIVLLGTAVRLYTAFRRLRNYGSPPQLFGDESGYVGLARGLLDGKWFDSPSRAPAYPVFLAAALWVGSRSYRAVLAIQAVIGGLTALPAYVLARRLFNPSVGVLTALAVALHWGLVIQAQRVYSEVLYTPMLLLAMIALYDAIDTPTPRRLLVAGAAFGVASLVRPPTLLLPFAFVVAFLVTLRHWRAVVRVTGTCVAGLLLVVAPWIVGNSVRYHTFVPLSTSGGVVWMGSPEYYRLHKQGRTYASIYEHELNPAENGGRNPWTSIEDDRYFNRLGLRSIRGAPGTYLRYTAEKVGWFWAGQPGVDWFNGRMMNPATLHSAPPRASAIWECCYRWREVAAVMASRLLPFAALIAAVLLRRHWRRLLPFFLLLAYFTLVHALTWPELRYQQPLAPYLSLLVAGAVVDIRERRASRQSPPRRHALERKESAGCGQRNFAK